MSKVKAMTRAAELQDVITENVRQAAENLDETRESVQAKGRRARKELAKAAKANRKELAKAAKAAHAELTSKAKESRGKKRRWPFLLILVAAAGAGVTAYLLSRRPQQTFSADADRLDEPMTSAHHPVEPTTEPVR